MTAGTLPVSSPQPLPDLRDAVTLRRADAFGGIDVMRGTYHMHSFPPHFHSTFAIGVMTRGVCALECRGTTYLLRAGHVVLLAPGDVHTGKQVGHEGWSNRVLYPAPNVLATLGRNGDSASSDDIHFRAPVVDDERLFASVLDLHRVLETSACPLEQESVALDVLGSIVATQGGERPEPRVLRHAAGMAAARDYLHAHCTEGVTLTTLANVAGLSCFYFLRLFRTTFGVTPHVYLALLRLERARALLSTARPIAGIAVNSGFSDQSHLTRFFKRVYGITPGVYARAARA